MKYRANESSRFQSMRVLRGNKCYCQGERSGGQAARVLLVLPWATSCLQELKMDGAGGAFITNWST